MGGMYLAVSQLDVRYAGQAQAAVQGVSLGLRAGQIGVLIGPSGCGKTTLLRAVAGLEPVSAGSIHLGQQLVGLEGSAERFPHELSGGQQQRVALARALAPRPQLMLLDEPFSNLDVDLRERLAHEVRGILKAAGATALFVTHDQLEAFAIGDVIGVMHHGQLHQWDDAYTLYHRPATRAACSARGRRWMPKATLRPTLRCGNSA